MEARPKTGGKRKKENEKGKTDEGKKEGGNKKKGKTKNLFAVLEPITVEVYLSAALVDVTYPLEGGARGT